MKFDDALHKKHGSSTGTLRQLEHMIGVRLYGGSRRRAYRQNGQCVQNDGGAIAQGPGGKPRLICPNLSAAMAPGHRNLGQTRRGGPPSLATRPLCVCVCVCVGSGSLEPPGIDV